ncbi:Dyp-type peroxidase [Geodermatophilus ruber]|uniref:Putative iron-dependent peroxidase n=1 Tax=Geodermatophilus ruber TaxID=504800 RepID=A0A1I4K4W1_9ACTN|nr:Dyp-type peroxidase [Geodermatophilus ruber]SFL73838.1 putative iron-dependent peroxidase [Geodermatophilus ruber]
MTVPLNPVTPVGSQGAIGPPTAAALFLVLTVDEGGEEVTHDLLSDLGGLRRGVGFRDPEGRLSCVAGIGSDVWNRLFSWPHPAGLHPFREVAGARHRAPATPGDLLFHLRAQTMDLCFELGGQIMDRLAGSVTLQDEVHGFKYFDERDLLGFVDGTENPDGDIANDVVFVGEEDPRFACSSYVVVQKYLHDLRAWNALSTEEQERAVGRTKLTDIELPDDVQPSNSHVALNTIEDPDGTERKIVRDNMPFGRVGHGEFGTYFIGYARDPGVLERMLQRMFVGDPPGNHDRLLDFSAAVTGTLFFVPTADFLEDPPPLPAEAAAAAAAGDPPANVDAVGSGRSRGRPGNAP